MDTRIIVVRHAQGEGNLKGEFHGQYNSDLTDLGIVQAECTAEALRDIPFDIAYSSDIARAYSTAKIVAKSHNIEIIKDTGLREICAGKWEQVRFDDLKVLYPTEYNQWLTDLPNFTCPDGESIVALQKRVNSAIQNIVSSNAGKTILIASHATPIRLMGCIWHGLDLSEVYSLRWVPNASYSIVDYDSKSLDFELIDYAHSEHLEKRKLLTELPKNI